ncbi:FUSC family protein [Pullulanibacillus sp. KACC 23026]|uniref:FUSC family protein n=1 Tax=Pullulanibacillus sp. KACC 23026 TaxID=3028315 RepID=UPI0023AFA3E6|nr:FUSC family protein [Pullulanibacillus sp. KACC 23026]WEG10810.1 FUSC family protein [Pullulanibacillus sp. KACC 23026]
MIFEIMGMIKGKGKGKGSLLIMPKSYSQFFYDTTLAWKLALGAGLSWQIAKWAGSTHPYLAPLSVILTLQVTVDQSIIYGLQRTLGTLAGVIITALFIPYIGLSAWSIALSILIASTIIALLGFSKIMMNQVALSMLLVLSFESHPSYGLDRVRDTLIGCILAVLINMLIFPPDLTKQAIKETDQFSKHLTEGFQNVGNWLKSAFILQEGEYLHQQAIGLLKELNQTINSYQKAEKSLRFHPFTMKSHQRLKDVQDQLKFLEHGYTRLINIIETLIEWNNYSEISAEQKHLWARRMLDIAHNYKSWMSNNETTNSTDLEETCTKWETDFIQPTSFKDYRWAYAIQNDTIQLLSRLDTTKNNRLSLQMKVNRIVK